MQLFALDDQRKIPAWNAIKRKNYRCFECGNVVRVRKGIYRRDHFYHIRNRSCRHSHKSIRHIQIQRYLQRILPTGECELEKIFLKILRIGDVVWKTKKIVFEIQCSHISDFEVLKRTQDYESIGYQVVWILDDHVFNKKKISTSEEILREKQCYFVQVSRFYVYFYDQFERIHREMRLFRSHPFSVQLDKPKLIPQLSQKNLNKLARKIRYRIENHFIYFTNDFLDNSLRSLNHKLVLKKRSSKRALFSRYFRKIREGYLNLIDALLEI